MKLSLHLLEKFIDLPTKNIQELRHIFDDLGLEVENVSEEKGDTIISIETLAQRGDHLSAVGIAREFSARYLCPMRPVEVLNDWNPKPFPRPVSVTSGACLRYALMKLDLKGDRIVDCLKSILLEIGQPMHAFDADKVEGSIHVVTSTKPEEIVALDGHKYLVPAGSVLVRDDKKTLAVAGVIGCANSMVTDATTHLFIESATFDPVSVRKTSKQMKISTDASYAFERGCDREQVIFSLKRLVTLLVQQGAIVPDIFVYYYPGEAVQLRKIPFSLERVRSQVNLSTLSDEEIKTRLSLLGYSWEVSCDGVLIMSPPSWREWSVKTQETIIEDFARSFSLNKIPPQLPSLDYAVPAVLEKEQLLSAIEPVLWGNGFFEVITKSYYSPESVAYLRELDPGAEEKHIRIKNSVEKEYSYLKITNIIHLAKLAEYNLKRNIRSFKVYECARVYGKTPRDGSYESEWDVLSLAVAHQWYDSTWKTTESLETMLYLFKGLLESVVKSTGKMSVGEGSISYLHPNCQATLVVDGCECGFFGRIHPVLKERLGMTEDLLYAELDLAKLSAKKEGKSSEFSDYPAMKRDLTILLPRHGLAGKVVEEIRLMAPAFLQELSIIDSFQKEGEDVRRVTYRLVFQSREKTLQKDEVDLIMKDLLSKMEAKYQMQVT
jgi:phenylalanyl-tRNA synthetase beta chain